MRVDGHVEKFDRLCRLRNALDSFDDFELWYWTTLTACTNAYNACLHLAGITKAERAFSTIPGMYVVPLDGGNWCRELRELGDVSHAGWPPVPGPLPDDIERLEHSIEAIEEYRDPCLRGDRIPDRGVVDTCDRAFDEVRSVLDARTKGHR